MARTAGQALLDRIGFRPRVAMLLGTGHATIADRLCDAHAVHTNDLPFGASFAPSATLTAGHLHGVEMVVGDAPPAYCEGHAAEHVTFPVRALRLAGADLLVLTAGAASLSRQLQPGDVAVLEDHVDLSGVQPLRGRPDDTLGPRFLDMSEPYAGRWRQMAQAVANELGLSCAEAVFAAVPGPSLPTRAECRFLERIGVDLVGASLVPEVVVARHAGMEVLALVAVMQRLATERPQPTALEAMIEAADVAGPRVTAILDGVLAHFASQQP